MPLICRPIDKFYLGKTTLNIIFIKDKDYLSSFVRKKSQKDKKSPKNCRSSRERLTTKKVIAMDVSEVSGSFVMHRFKPNLLLACPNFPSIALRKLSSSCACFFSPALRFFGGLPKGNPLNLIPLSLHHAKFSLVR